jgi:hypothetical protein
MHLTKYCERVGMLELIYDFVGFYVHGDELSGSIRR